MEVAQDLKDRGFAEQESAPLSIILGKKRTVYHGIDPTADSLHVGHLVQVLLMKRLADAGHKIIFLVGGGTGMIGDPKEKGERVLLDMRTVADNKRALKAQLQQIIGRRVSIVDNADWLLKVKLVDFLRDIGKHFTINELVKRELIKRRLDAPDESISFTEFSYSLLQAYDFLTLYQKKGVNVQVGGSDQWTNLLSGVELIRRKFGKEAFAFTGPLVTDSSGKKFGKSEGNAVWLDAKKTSPFAFYQFWLNLPDDGIEKYFMVYTFMSVPEVNALVEMHKRNPGKREAQRMLAKLVTETVHGKVAAANAAAVSDVLFSSKQLSELSASERAMLMTEAPSVTISSAQLQAGFSIIDALVVSGLSSSKSDARRLIEGKGVSLNGEVIESPDFMLTSAHFTDTLALLRRGKQIALLTIEK